MVPGVAGSNPVVCPITQFMDIIILAAIALFVIFRLRDQLGKYSQEDQQMITKRVEQQKIQEGKRILNKVTSADYLVLMDEKGKQMDSPTFASWIAKKQDLGAKRCIFVIGGPYGFSDDLYQRADEKIALSKMTFSHQMVRLFFVEQLYRAYTILNNEPYHHQ